MLVNLDILKSIVSYYYNNEYSILLYKENECIEELLIDITKIDFGDCYTKVQENLIPNKNDNIIIAIIQLSNSKGQSTSTFYFFHPETSEKIEIENICAEDIIIIKENILSQLNNTDLDYNSIVFSKKALPDIKSLFNNPFKLHSQILSIVVKFTPLLVQSSSHKVILG